MCSCTSEKEPKDLLVEQNELMSEVSTRKIFENHKEFELYFNSAKDECQKIINTRSSEFFEDSDDSEILEGKAIVNKFLEYTSMGKIFNSEYEIQIGDTIIKLGNDGYTIYKIYISRYKDAIDFLNWNSSILDKIDKYKKLSDLEYEIESGIILWYSGEPLIKSEELFEITDITPEQKQELYDLLRGTNITESDIKLRSGDPLVPYELTVNFWTSYTGIYKACGPEIKYKELQGSTYKNKSTYLHMFWNDILLLFGEFNWSSPNIIHIANGYKFDTGSSDKKTFHEMFTSGGGHYYLIGGYILGEAMNSNGDWVNKIYRAPYSYP